MYPRVEVTVEGLNASSMYSIGMTVIPVDDKRYKYKDNVWSAVGKSGINHPITPYKHPISPATGSYWTKDILSFGHVKLSNHLGPNKICLESMHKYLIQINVVHHSRDDHLYSFILPGTDFIALTAYLNENITRLKISHNPFARAFKNKKISSLMFFHTGKPGLVFRARLSLTESGMLPIKSRETPHVSYESTSSSGNSVMDGSMNHSLSSAGDIMRRKFMEGTTGGNGCLPMMCLLTSSGLYYQSLPYYRQDDRLTGPAIQSTYANKYMV
ncbi:T-box transcription factor TBX5-A [Mizuhopecten yessoensis]|uniref:T-box transcription factor TBX5-A n=1 Tax=Mizuhopecten yessoensis TaxID=6573 RepID=A0A210QG18_MIZYE|nr:T-box transcription factor TBX5-A [Mizuhopecten yessoensis]